MSRVMDMQYRLYDRLRHRRAFEVAREEGAASDFGACRGARQCLVVSFKRSGEPVPTPVNFGLDDEGRLYFRSEPHVAKVKRIKRDPHVRVVPCNFRGKPTGPSAEGRARVLLAGSPDEEHAAEVVASNWSPPTGVFERGLDRAGVEVVYVEVTPA